MRLPAALAAVCLLTATLSGFDVCERGKLAPATGRASYVSAGHINSLVVKGNGDVVPACPTRRTRRVTSSAKLA
jgi:hypothetical protein